MKKRTRALFLKVITFFQIFTLTFQPLSLLSVLVLDPVVARAQSEAVVEEQVLAEPVVEANVQAEPAADKDAEEIIEPEDSDEDLINIEENLEEAPPVANEEEPGEDATTDEADPKLSIPEPTLTLIPTPIPTVAIAEEAQELATTCLSPEQEVNITYSNWSVNEEEDSAQSIDKVQLGVEYAFPLDPAVSVVFTCLPEKEEDQSTIKIQRVLVSDLNLPDSVQTDALYAYDITTDMSNGSFKYDLTLPKPEGVEAGVVYIEESIEKVKEGVESEDIKMVEEEKIDQKKNSVEVEGLDHFTILIVSTTVKISGQVNGSDKVTVTPGATITVTMEVKLSDSEPNDWNSSRYQIEGGSYACVDTPNHTDTGTHSESFNITAPTTPGTYDLTLRAYAQHNCSGGQSEKVMKDAIIVQTPSNPSLPTQACGLDIALVLDVSGSISASELKQMKDAFKAFVDALSGTPTQFSVIKFDNTASILLPFTSVTTTAGSTAIKNAIDNASGGGYTNWEDGLNKAWLTYNPDPRSDKPNLIIFSSDGNPNRIGAGTSVSEAQAVAAAVAVANTIKAAGTRILALGIGSDLKTGNMIAISGPNVNTGEIVTSDVISTNFSTLATELGKLASKTCGGTITVNKYIDDTSTPGGAGWTYTVSSGTITKYLETGTDGSANTDKITAGTYSVVETGIPLGYTYGSATCTNKAGATVGSIITNGRGSITVSDEDIISCDFINTTNKGFITIIKDAQPNHAQDFTFTPTGSGLSEFTLDDDDDNTLSNTEVFNNLTPGEFTVTEDDVSGWNLKSISCDTEETVDLANRKVTINLTPGENVTCTFVNTLSTGNIIVDKVTEPAGDTTSFSFTTTGSGYNGFSLKDTDSPNNQQLAVGTYSVSESTLSGWTKKSAVCVSSEGDTETIGNLKLDAGETITCTFTNTKHGSISGYKVIDKDGLDSTIDDRRGVSGWTIFIDKDGNGVLSEGDMSTTTNGAGYYEFTDLLPGTYKVYEALQSGWIVLVVGNHTVELTAGENRKGVDFINVKQGSITVKKNVDANDDGDLLDDEDTTGATDWKWTLNEAEKTTGSTVSPLNPGTYTIKEVNKDNYHFVSLECTGAKESEITKVNDTATINLKAGEDIVCTYTNTRDTGTITIIKNSVNKSRQDFYFKTDFPSGGFYLEDDGDNYGTPNQKTFTLPTGKYSIDESEYAGWQLTDLVCTGDRKFSKVNLAKGQVDIDLRANKNITCTFTNTQLAKIWGYKYNDKNGNGSWNLGEWGLGDWRIFLNKNGSWKHNKLVATTLTSKFPLLLTLGYYQFDNLLPGKYTVCEEQKVGWSNTSPLCKTITLKPGEIANVNFFNIQYGQLTAHKYYDYDRDGDGLLGDEEQGLKGWRMNVYKGNNCWGEPMTSARTNHNGDAVFKNLVPGQYSVKETLRDGWQTTSDVCTTIKVEPASHKTVNIGNQLISGQLMIEKSNDAWPNDQEIGDEVTYTIKIMATDGPVYGVSLFDLPPNAFSYVAGSYTANSSIAGALSLSEPNYASPGKWQLGDLAEDEIITVSYKAIIGDEADAGIYPDAAWATGTSAEARYFEGEEAKADLLALSDPDFEANNGGVAFLGDQGHYGEEHFVGTRVAVVTDETPSAKYKVEKIKEKEGEVLGAVLPATGANFWLSLLAILSILTGTGLLLVPNRKRRQGKVLMMLLMLGLGLLMAKPVQAITSVRLAQPYNSSAELDQDTITNQDEFRIDFVILNTEGLSLTAQCQQQEDGGAWTNIDTVYTVKAGGNSGYCEAKDLANSSQYAFRVLTSDGEEGQSVKVGLETDRPKKPVSYEKNQISSCKYEIKFKTADDGRTSKVEVYRSDDNVSFTAKASSRIKTISIGSDEKHSFETTRPDCDKDYYYAIRAFDQYGNASDLVGDHEVKTVIVEGTAEVEEATGALAVTEIVILDGDVGDDGVLSEGLLGEEVAEDEKGTILGIDTESLVSFLTKVALPILVFVTISILVYRLVIAKRNEK